MKAIKLNKIQWNLNGLSKEEMEKVLETLPTVKGFMAQDDFNVVEKVPGLLKKHYGYDVISYNYSEIRVVENLEDLLLLCAPKGEKVKDLYKASGELSQFGKKCKDNLVSNIKWRLRLEFKGTNPGDMPTILDEVMIGVKKVTGMEWDDHTVEELMSPIMKKINDKKAVNLKEDYEDIEEDVDEMEMEEED